MELWKDVKGYEKLYQVSNLGKIKRIAGVSGGKKPRYIKERMLNDSFGEFGYAVVTLCKNGICKNYRKARLIAFTFNNVDYNDKKYVVNHKDFNRTNDQVDNLEVITQKENLDYSWKNNRFTHLKPISLFYKGKLYEFVSRSKLSILLGHKQGYIANKIREKKDIVTYVKNNSYIKLKIFY
jgi:hypothetical protein